MLLTGLWLSVGICSQVAGEAPSWTTQTPNRPDLLQGIGNANDTGSPEEDRRRADNYAVAEIMSEIRTTVTSTLSSYYQEEARGGRITSSAEVVTRISAQYAQETVEGIKISERYYDAARRIYYAYAFISREQLEQQFRAKAGSTARLCGDYHRHAQEALQRRDIYGAIEHYIRALGELFVAQAYLKRKIEGDLDGTGQTEMLQARLESEFSVILSGLYFEVVSGNDQRAERNRALELPLVGRVFYRDSDGGSWPVSNLPITFTLVNATGDLTLKVITAQDGTFTGRLNLIQSAAAEVGLIRAGLAISPELEPFQGELAGMTARLQQTACSFNFHIAVAASVRIFVDVKEEINGVRIEQPYTTGILVKSLVGNQFTVVQSDQLQAGAARGDLEQALQSGDAQAVARAVGNAADYAVVGRVASEVKGGSDAGLKFAYASADVRVIDLKGGRVLASSVPMRVKGGGGDEAGANQAAIKKCADIVAAEINARLKEALK